MDNPYKILGVDEKSSQEEIKSAFKSKAKKFHPDAVKDESAKANAENEFKKISNAYEILSDPQKRANYDAQSRQRQNQGQFNGGAWSFSFNQGFPFMSYGYGHFRAEPTAIKFNIDVIAFHRNNEFKCHISTKRKCQSCDGKGYSSKIEVDCQCLKSNDIRIIRMCHMCGGTGKVISGKRCDSCYGSCTVENKREINFVKDGRGGSSLLFELKNEGNYDPRSGTQGDLFCRIEAVENKLFSVNNSDVLTNVWIDYKTAACGGKIKVPSIDGFVEMSIPPGTLDGSLFRLEGLGLLTGRNKVERGHQFTKIKIDVPQMDEKMFFEDIKSMKHERVENFYREADEVLNSHQKVY